MDSHDPCKSAEARAGTGSPGVANPSRTKIDVSRYVAAMERVLCAACDTAEQSKIMAILRRWQFDEMLDDQSRQQARLLVSGFEPCDSGDA